MLAEHPLVAPGETSIDDTHYDRPRPDRPNRAPRPRTQVEKDFCALGPVAEAFLVGAAAAGVSKLGGELVDILALGAAHGEPALVAALERAVTYRRWRAGDLRSILATGGHGPTPPPGRAAARRHPHPAVGANPVVGRLQDHQGRAGAVVVTAPPVLPADLNDGLKRLKMAAMRRLAPELLITAKTQRWSPEEFLRTLVEAEITARDASNTATRPRQAGFPVTKTLDEYDLTASSIPQATFDYLASLEWVRAAENVCLIGPAGTGKSHLLLALGSAAVDAGHKVRYLTAADLVDTLYRGLADNSVGRVIDTLLRNELILVDELGFAPLDDTAAQLLFRFVAAAYERRSLGLSSHWPFESWGRFLPEHTTAVSMLDRLLHQGHTVVTDGESYRMRQARQRGGTKTNNS